MTSSLLLAVFAAGFVYGITPGPGVLAVFGIGAARGRRAGAAFLAGHLAGDVLWCGTALVAIVGAREISPTVFDVLGALSGLYLLWLGVKAIRTRRSATGMVERPMRAPLAHGLVFGLTNPKSYPVAVATFTALLSSRAATLSWDMLPQLVAISFAGGLAAYAILIAVVGARHVRTLYTRHEVAITRATGVMFVGFALSALIHAVPGLLSRRI
ncbi:LysE family translocator [Zavarzinia sp. CC-PAN008]|uniref:LysE family translocator n=1 Tax=Zavarzinia sp. CC-PAN008 TaxID=3243332 RepID=UPI003F74A219